MHQIEQLKSLYLQYIPTKKESLFLFSIYKQIKSGDINEHFSHDEVREILKQIYESETPRVDDFLRHLLMQFIERPRRHDGGKYRLTEYAKSFVELIFGQVENLRKKYSLSDSLKQYAYFNAEDFKSYQDFERWYQQSFNDTARRTINDHIAGLSIQIKENIKQLSRILSNENQRLGEKIFEFSNSFESISQKANDIQYTLQFRSFLFDQLEIFLNKLFKKEIVTYSEFSEQNNVWKDGYNNAQVISDQIHQYFEEVNEKLSVIIDNLKFAEEKLADLQSNFNAYSYRRINIKKLLGIYLDNSEYDRNNSIKFSIDLPRKDIITESFRFREINKYDFELPSKRERFLPKLDNIYFEQKKKEIEFELENQKIINTWITLILEKLNKERFVDLSEYFWIIHNQYNEIEIAIKVCFDIINFISSKQEYLLIINKELQTAPNGLISIWQMKITQK